MCAVGKLVNFIHGLKKILMVLFNFIPILFKTFYHRNIKGRIESWKGVEFNATHYLEVETKANISTKWLI